MVNRINLPDFFLLCWLPSSGLRQAHPDSAGLWSMKRLIGVEALIITLSSEHSSGAREEGGLCAEGQEWLILGQAKWHLSSNCCCASERDAPDVSVVADTPSTYWKSGFKHRKSEDRWAANRAKLWKPYSASKSCFCFSGKPVSRDYKINAQFI